MAEELVSEARCTALAVCRHFELHRSTYAYRAKEADACVSMWIGRSTPVK